MELSYFEELKSTPAPEKLYKNKTNAAYSQETQFRGSKFAEAGWSENGQQLYRDVLKSLKRNEDHEQTGNHA